jgi:hypothetical protein
MFSNDQRHVVDWYTTWSDTFEYVMWHHLSDDNVSSIIPNFASTTLFTHQFSYSSLPMAMYASSSIPP